MWGGFGKKREKWTFGEFIKPAKSNASTFWQHCQEVGVDL